MELTEQEKTILARRHKRLADLKLLASDKVARGWHISVRRVRKPVAGYEISGYHGPVFVSYKGFADSDIYDSDITLFALRIAKIKKDIQTATPILAAIEFARLLALKHRSV